MKASLLILALILACALCTLYLYILQIGHREERGMGRDHSGNFNDNHHNEREFGNNNDMRDDERDGMRHEDHHDKHRGPGHHSPPPPPDFDDLPDKDHTPPEDVKPLCGKLTECVNGTETAMVYNVSILTVHYKYYENDECSDESVLSINSTYFIKYKREKEGVIREIDLHMLNINATALNEKGVEKLKGMVEKYCENVTIAVGENINLMKVCHKLVKREFKTHIKGEYYYDEDKNAIYIMTWSREEVMKYSKNVDKYGRVKDNRDEYRDAKVLKPFECSVPTGTIDNRTDPISWSSRLKEFMRKAHNHLRRRRM